MAVCPVCLAPVETHEKGELVITRLDGSIVSFPQWQQLIKEEEERAKSSFEEKIAELDRLIAAFEEHIKNYPGHFSDSILVLKQDRANLVNTIGRGSVHPKRRGR